MEGDLLGLGFDPIPTPNQATQGSQLFQQQQQPTAVQFTTPTAQFTTPTAQFTTPTAQFTTPTAQFTTPTAQFTTPTVQLAPPPHQQHPSPAAPPVQAAPPTVQNQPIPVQNFAQPSTQQPTPVPQASQPGNDQQLNIHATTDTFTFRDQIQTNTQRNDVWRPAPVVVEIKDPVLKEIQEKFGGRWKLARSDPYDEYLKAAGVGIFTRKLAITGMPEQHIFVSGDIIHINFHSTLFNQIYKFSLGESIENYVEKTRQSVFCSYKDGKLTLLMTPLEPGLNRTQEIQRFLNEHGELVLIYTCGNVTCRRYFTRMYDFVSPLNIVA